MKSGIQPDAVSLFDTDDLSIGFVERILCKQGITDIIGVDEAGRGPLAGPVVAAAVALPDGYIPEGLNDSKKLSEAKRNVLYGDILDNALAIGISFSSPEIIDKENILQATLKAMSEAIDQASERLKMPPLCLIDGNRRVCTPFRQQTLVKGDSKSSNIAAASIVAKVVRDFWMDAAESFYPGYGLAKHKGYGVKAHKAAIKDIGPCILHRLTFRGVREHINEHPELQREYQNRVKSGLQIFSSVTPSAKKPNQ